MVRFINKVTGAEMWVSEDRVEEYKAAGHKLPVVPTPDPPAAQKAATKAAPKPAARNMSRKTKK